MSDDQETSDPYGQDEFTDARSRGRHPAELASQLTRWLRTGPPAQPTAAASSVEVPGGGASSDLFLVEVDGLAGVEGLADGRGRIAVRLAPSYAVYPVVDLAHQYELTLAASDHSPAPVPRPIWYEPDDGWLGAEVIVSVGAPGVVGDDVLSGWMVDLSPQQQRRLWERSVEQLAALHTCDLDNAGIRDRGLPVAGGSSLDRALAYWELYLRFVSEHDEFPLLELAVSRLRRDRPDEVLPDALVWGDARLGNMLFVDGEPSALLDFEFTHVGLREFDIAFFSIFDWILSVHFMNAQRLPGFAGHSETLDYYEHVSGHRLGHREYFTLMACTYSALATTRVLQGRADAGYVDPTFVHRHGPMAALAELLDQPLA